MKFCKRILILTAALLSLSLLSVVTFVGYAADEITSCINLSNVRMNESGSGYSWANRTDVLTLTNLRLNTSDEYGLKLPADCTVILEGDNYIKAERVGISYKGSVTFKGTGTLTVIAGDYGIYANTAGINVSSRITEGKFDITAGKCGIYAPDTTFLFVGGEMNISVSDQSSGFAVNGGTVKLMGGKISADSVFSATRLLQLNAVNLTATATRPVLSSPNPISLDRVEISAGDSADSLSVKDSYTNEASVSLKSTRSFWGQSFIFGEKCPAFVDYILTVVLALGIVSLSLIPFFRAKKKAKEAAAILAEYEKMPAYSRRSDRKKN